VNATPDNWGKAFAKQALADFEAWNELQGNTAIPSCQKLHFLQMACENLCKAHLGTPAREDGSGGKVQRSTASSLPTVTEGLKTCRWQVSHLGQTEISSCIMVLWRCMLIPLMVG
jgi:hypothetical protein